MGLISHAIVYEMGKEEGQEQCKPVEKTEIRYVDVPREVCVTTENHIVVDHITTFWAIVIGVGLFCVGWFIGSLFGNSNGA